MASGQTVTEVHVEVYEDDEVTKETAEEYGEALAVVQRLLRAQGIRSCLFRTISLKLLGSGGPHPYRWRTPELVVANSRGSRDATVRVGPRSGCYFVTIRNRTGLETVREPQKVADLILASRRGSAA
ncbi:hypothetical protein [Streptosporangium sp. NPDC002524]|uniref:hypothetical protein n=1 Tax=Streptosporangium sp. NPDC002524 TaxID=3154537 RepID=UPI00331B8CD0